MAAGEKINQLPSGSASDNSLGIVADPQTGKLYQTGYKALKDYFQQGLQVSINTGSLATTASFNTFTASYSQDSASFNLGINNVSGSQGKYLQTASFNTFSSSYNLDSGSFDIRINALSGSSLATASFNSFSASVSSQVSNVFASQSNYTQLSFFNTYTGSVNTQLQNVYASESNYLSTGSYLIDSASFNNRLNNITASGGTGISGSGTINYVPLFSGANSLSSSILQQSGNTVILSGSLVIPSASSGNISIDATGNVNVGGNKVILLSPTVSNNPPMTEFRRIQAGTEIGRGSIGYLGSSEMNISNNMDYTNGSHKYYNPSQSAMWMFMGNVTNQFGMQWTKAGHPNDDTMWTTYGRVVWQVDVLPDFNGEAVTYGSRMRAQQLYLIDGNATGSAGTFVLSSGILTIAGAATTLQPPNLFRFIKQSGSSYNIGAGTVAMSLDVNGGVSQNGARGAASGNAPGGFTNMEYYWKTTNPAGTYADRMVLNESGYLGIGNSTPTAYADLHASTVTGASLRIRSGVAPTGSNDGDVWYDGSVLNFRSGSVTQAVITATSASAPGNASTPALWAAVAYNGSSYRLPLYQ